MASNLTFVPGASSLVIYRIDKRVVCKRLGKGEKFANTPIVSPIIPVRAKRIEWIEDIEYVNVLAHVMVTSVMPGSDSATVNPVHQMIVW